MNVTKLRKSEIAELKSSIPYHKMDNNIVELVKVLNSFDDVYTTASCGGHKSNKDNQVPDGEWYVIFRVNQSKAGWISLEFLIWLFNKCLRADDNVMINAYSPPPFVNGELGSCICFILEGKNESLEELVEDVKRFRDEFYKESVFTLGH